MRKVVKKRSAKKQSITVTLVRPVEDDQVITLPAGSTVEEALEKLNFSLPSGQTLYVGRNEAELEDNLEDEDILQVIGKKEGGNDEATAEEKDEDEEERQENDEATAEEKDEDEEVI